MTKAELYSIWTRDADRSPWGWDLMREKLAKRIYDALNPEGPDWRLLAYKTRNKYRRAAQTAKGFYMDVLAGGEP